MFRLQYTNSRGQSIELFGAPYRLTKVDGLGDVDADIQAVRAPYQDGDTYIDTVLDVRHISIELKIQGSDAAETEANRRRFASVFNPKLGPGELRYIRGDEVKVIRAVAEAVPSFPDGGSRTRQSQKALLFLQCPDPYWRSLTVTEEPMAAFVGQFKFPMRLPTKIGVQGTRRTILNKGDVTTPIHIEMKGPAVNPIVHNRSTGEFLRINRTLNAGDVLFIDTDQETKSIMINGEDAFGWIDLASTFFGLIPGENILEYNADSGRDEATVKIRWQTRYVGV